MSWSAPATWTSGHIVTAAELNQELRDNLNALNTQIRTVWVPVTAYYSPNNPAPMLRIYRPLARLYTAAGVDLAAMSWLVPTEFSSLVSAAFIVQSGITNAAADWDCFVERISLSGNTETSTSDVASTYNVVSGYVYAIDQTALFASIAAGEVIGARVWVGTTAHSVDVLGLKIRYYASL